MVLWYGETERHRGALESEALYLMGVEPVWNARGVVDDVRLIPDAELGRPRVNVLFTISGIYRDGFGDKVALLDKAARGRRRRRQRAEPARPGRDGRPACRRHRGRTAGAGGARGCSPPSRQLCHRRVADGGAEPRHRGARCGGGAVPALHELRLFGRGAGAPACRRRWPATSRTTGRCCFRAPAPCTARSTTTTPTSTRAGWRPPPRRRRAGAGLLAAQPAHGRRGRAPSMPARLATELNARNWNPKWIAAMRSLRLCRRAQMFKEIEHLYGFRAATPEQMSGQFWQRTYDVYVADSEGRAWRPSSAPAIRTPAVDPVAAAGSRPPGSYRFSAAQRADMVRRYVASVARDGLSCSANTCGNPALMRYIEGLRRAADTDAQAMRRFAGALAQATAAGPAAAPAGTGAARGGQAVPARQARDTRQALRRQSAAPPRSRRGGRSAAAGRARHAGARAGDGDARAAARRAGPAVAGGAAGALGVGALMLLAIGAGALAEWRRGRRRRP